MVKGLIDGHVFQFLDEYTDWVLNGSDVHYVQ